MGMQQKLDKEYLRGYQDGQTSSNEILMRMARNEGMIIGAQDTWDIIEDMIPKLKGIGPKTTAKIMRAIQTYAKNEKEKLKAK